MQYYNVDDRIFGDPNYRFKKTVENLNGLLEGEGFKFIIP